MKKQIVVAVFIIFCMASCTTTREFATSRTQEINQTALVQIPKLAKLDINVRNKVNGACELRAKTGKIPNIIQESERLALMDALKKNQADVLVEPTYHTVYKVNPFVEKATTVVEGYYGHYIDLRDITAEDSSLVKTIKMLNCAPGSTIYAPVGFENHTVQTYSTGDVAARKRRAVAIGLGIGIPVIVGAILGGVLGGM